MQTTTPTDETVASRCERCGETYEEPAGLREMFPDARIVCDPCETALRREEEQLRRESAAIAEWEATVPAVYRKTDEAHPEFPREINRACQQWLSGRGIGSDERLPFLGLIGASGLGKTRVVSRMVRRLIWEGARVVWCNSSRFQWAAQNAFNDAEKAEAQKWLKTYQSASWLVLDDVGSLKSTEAVTDALYAVLERRTANELPMIWSSNETLDEMIPKAPEKVRARIISRLGGFSNTIHLER